MGQRKPVFWHILCSVMSFDSRFFISVLLCLFNQFWVTRAIKATQEPFDYTEGLLLVTWKLYCRLISDPSADIGEVL